MHLYRTVKQLYSTTSESLSWSLMSSWWKGLNKRKGFHKSHFPTEMSYLCQLIIWVFLDWGLSPKRQKSDLEVKWWGKRTAVLGGITKASRRAPPDWLPGRRILISCIFWAGKKITLRIQGCIAAYFIYGFQNCSYQMSFFDFLKIGGLTCWTWYHENAKKSLGILFVVYLKILLVQRFFFFLVSLIFFSRYSVIFYISIIRNCLAVGMLLLKGNMKAPV